MIGFFPHTWRLFGVCRGLSEQVLRYGFGDPQCFCVAQGRKTATELIDVQREQLLNREIAARISAGPEGRSAGASLRTVLYVLATAVCYYVATQVAWALCFPDSKVSLFFPPHAVLVSILLFVPTRQWWAYTLAAASAHFLATQQAHWPTVYALHCEVFDAVQNVGAAAGIRILIKSPLKAITLRDAILFVLIAVVPRSFWDRLLGGFLYGLLRFRHPLLDRMAQSGNLECGHGRRPDAGISAGCTPSVRQTPESPIPPTRAGSGSRRCVYGGARNLRIR